MQGAASALTVVVVPGDGPHAAFQAAAGVGTAVRGMASSRARTPQLQVQVSEGVCPTSTLRAAALGNYTFPFYKSDPGAGGYAGLACDSAPDPAALALLQADITGSTLARHLGNLRGGEVNPGALGDMAAALVAQDPALASVSIVRGLDEVRAQGWHCLAGVGAASASAPLAQQPAMIHVQYRGARGGGPPPLALVGKGITFDTGGLHLKPSGAIENMHLDMGGAAAVLGALASLMHSKPAVDVDLLIPAAENAVSATAYRPLDILRSKAGKTVEVGNTDAEGRLALVDAFHLAQTAHAAPPGALVDVATLTGACVVALGHHAAGLFSKDPAFQHRVQSAGEAVGERLWPLPLLPQHEEEITTGSKHADLMSIGAGREAGASTAAAFLAQFIEPGVAWAHLDIAGPGMLPKPHGVHPAGGTGFAAQTLAELARRSGTVA